MRRGPSDLLLNAGLRSVAMTIDAPDGAISAEADPVTPGASAIYHAVATIVTTIAALILTR